jgi:hypothetical protein
MNDNFDLTRLFLGAYQSREEKPVRVEDGEVFGQVNPCRYGEQCGWHACYCNHAKGPRKCRRSWYTGGKEPDAACEHYEANPYWRERETFEAGRKATIAWLREQGLVEDVE